MKFINDILAAAYKNGQSALDEADCYRVMAALGLRTPKFAMVPPAADISAHLAGFAGDKIVIKILSHQTLHKTDKGGVKVCAKADAPAVLAQMAKAFPEAANFMLVEFANYTPFTLGSEVLLGARADKAFGPLLTLGIGGTDSEALAKKFAPAIAPANGLDAAVFVQNSPAWRYVGGVARGAKQNAQLADLANWAQKLGDIMLAFDGRGEFTIEEFEINPLAAVGGQLVALDGVLRFKKSEPATAKTAPTQTGIKALLEPKTAAVAGVSGDKINMGRIILRNIIAAGFERENIYILKKDSGEIDGVKCYASCADFPKKVDMFVVTVPAATAADVLKDATGSGKINGLVLISGGIGEKEGSAGVKDEVAALIASAKQNNPDFTLNGSNSLGIVSNPAKINTLFIEEDKLTPPLGEPGAYAPAAFISQSGAFVISALGKMPHIKPLYSVMTGNELDITVPDYAAYLADEQKTKVILLYIEGLKSGQGALLEAAVRRARANGKTVVIYMAGRTPSGQKAVMGHTASIAGDYPAARQILARAGALMANSFEEFETFAQLACSYAAKKPKNGKVFMMSNAGFETSGMADNILPGGPVCAPYPSPALKARLQEVLKKYRLDGIVDVRNPFDVTPMCPDAAALEAAQAVFESGEYGSFIFATIPLSPVMKTLQKDNPDFMQNLAALAAKHNIPAVASVSAGQKFDYYRSTALQAGLSVFSEADAAIKNFTLFIQGELNERN